MNDDRLFALPPAVRRQRHLSPIDLIFCQSDALFTAMIAHNAGWVLGMQSNKGSMQRWRAARPWLEARKARIDFIDNEWHDYDHARHIELVAELNPKYATTRDYVTQQQAEEAGVAYYSLDEILDMAAELEKHAEQVIIIPKHDIIANVPERYVLGYSVPSSYGATPLPLEAFRGRKVHLLGGSWKTQRTYLQQLPDDVVSIDMNQQLKMAFKGGFFTQQGEVKQMYEDLGQRPRNTWVCALALSLGNIAQEVDGFSKLRAHRSHQDEIDTHEEAVLGNP